MPPSWSSLFSFSSGNLNLNPAIIKRICGDCHIHARVFGMSRHLIILLIIILDTVNHIVFTDIVKNVAN